MTQVTDERTLNDEQRAAEEQRLKSYLEAESKYAVAPIPAPVDLRTATQFVNNHVTGQLAPEKMSKLARLAILHDLRETAPAFMAILKNAEQKTIDFQRSAWALIALAWIANAEQLKFSQSYLPQLESRADVWETRLIMLDATEAFGPSEGTEKHRSWVLHEIERRKSLLSEYQTQNKQAETRGVQIQIDELEEHLNVRVAAVDRSNAIRSQVLGLLIEARISRLTALYLGTESVTPTLSAWAGFTLVRVANQDAHAGRIAAQFLTAAKQKEGAESDLQSLLIRARGLRAAEYFGGSLTAPDRQWLRAQADPGTDLLALRPFWVYS